MEQLKENCYNGYSSTPYWIVTIGMLTSLFINCYMFFAGQTLTTRFLLYIKQLFSTCCCFCCNKSQTIIESQLGQLSKLNKINYYPFIIQISSINTKDPKVLDLCGFYKRSEKISDKIYLYESTFKSYITKSILILHYSYPPSIILTKLNTITFDGNHDTETTKKRSTITNTSQQWIITSLSTLGIVVNNPQQSKSKNNKFYEKIRNETSTFGSSGVGEFLKNNCNAVAIQNMGNKNPSQSLDFVDYDNKFSLLQNPIHSLLMRPYQLWIVEDMSDTKTNFKHILNIESGNISYYLSSFIAIFMVILAFYQLYIDGNQLFKYILNTNHDKNLNVKHLDNYECYCIIITNSPSFKQIFLILACLIIGRTNAVIYVKHLSIFRKLLGIVYIIYPVLYLPIFISHTIPFLVLYLSPLIIVFGIGIWKLLKMQKMKKGLLYGYNDDNDESMKDEMFFLCIGFIFIFLVYILSILSVSTMIRFYGGQTYFDSVGSALWERPSDQYFVDKLDAFGEFEQLIEVLYRMI